MITTINNAHRLFLVTGDYNTRFVCNLEDLEKCCAEVQDKSTLSIKHMWNNKFVKCSKKSIIDMLMALNLNYKFL